MSNDGWRRRQAHVVVSNGVWVCYNAFASLRVVTPAEQTPVMAFTGVFVVTGTCEFH